MCSWDIQVTAGTLLSPMSLLFYIISLSLLELNLLFHAFSFCDALNTPVG